MVNVLMGKPPKIYYVLPESFAPGTLRFMKNIVPFFRGKCKRFVYYPALTLKFILTLSEYTGFYFLILLYQHSLI